MAKVSMKNSAGVVKRQKVGFSWTTMFFGAWVQLFRGNWTEFFKWFFFAPITLGIWGIIQCFTTNRKEIIRLTEKGYAPATPKDHRLLDSRGIIAFNNRDTPEQVRSTASPGSSQGTFGQA